MRLSAILGVGVIALASIACGGDACADAVDKLEECKAEGVTTTADSCENAADECAADCINNASCDEINSADASGPFFECIVACASG